MAHEDAYQRITTEAWNSPTRETGGILVGRSFKLHQGLVLVVVGASGPGAGADRQRHTYAPDVTSHQRELVTWRRHYAAYQVDYVGEWHKHPPGHRQPSSGDTQQVRAILNDPDYRLPYGIFTPLVTIEQGECRLHGYYYPRETMLPAAVEWQCTRGDDDLRELLLYLVGLETEQRLAGSSATG